jgi:hypothetical protein
MNAMEIRAPMFGTHQLMTTRNRVFTYAVYILAALATVGLLVAAAIRLADG